MGFAHVRGVSEFERCHQPRPTAYLLYADFAAASIFCVIPSTS